MIKKAVKGDIPHIYRMMLENSYLGDIFVADDVNFIRKHIKSTLIFHDLGAPHAYLLVRVPKLEKDNLGYDIGFSEKADLLKVVHMESCVVDPLYRGNHIMKSLLEIAIEEYAAKGFEHVMATVHPDNQSSMRSLKAVGLEEVMVKQKYHGVPRSIMYMKVK